MSPSLIIAPVEPIKDPKEPPKTTSVRLPEDVESKLRELGGTPLEGVRQILKNPPAITKQEIAGRHINLGLTQEEWIQLNNIGKAAGIKSLNEVLIRLTRAYI